MIFVTVGAQMPFDRLIRTVDEWAEAEGHEEALCQTGDTDYEPRAMRSCSQLQPKEFVAMVGTADLVVSHAGMGTILTCLREGTPVLVMPRRGELGETRNDHQVDTCKRLQERPGIHVADNEMQLAEMLGRHRTLISSFTQISPHASTELLERIRLGVRVDRRPLWDLGRASERFRRGRPTRRTGAGSGTER